MTERIQCTHCSNPDQGVSPCRWLWNKNFAKWQWETWGYDLPCTEDRKRLDEEAVRRRRSRAMAISLKCAGGAVVLCLALYLRSH